MPGRQEEALELGERLRGLRRERGWSLEELADRCGVSRSMLSQVERDEANPTLAVAFRIAAALGVELSELARPPTSTPITVLGHDDSRLVFRDDKDCLIRTVSPLELEKDVEVYEVVLRVGGTLSSSAHHRGTREFVAVQAGSVRLAVGTGTATLTAGDGAHYRADTNHELANVGEGEARLLLVDVYGAR